ncbi:unnamed protein product, partial [Heterotrigona itama]
MRIKSIANMKTFWYTNVIDLFISLHKLELFAFRNGLFGKRKDDKSEIQEKRSTITTVSSTYKRESYVKSMPVPPHITRDQQEFNEALGTLTRRRKHTLDNSSSRYSSSLTVNGDPARLYDGSPQETTTSIMGDLTPKPPARRFGQTSPKPTDKLPPLDFENENSNDSESVTLREKIREKTPVPPLRRFGNRSSQRMNTNNLDLEEEADRLGDVMICDENENVSGDYMFKRYSQDTVRKSNLSINSCVSVGSTMSSYGRKKRRAPQPPRHLENAEKTNEKITEGTNIELQIVEPIDIAKVTENIDDLTKKSKNLDGEIREVNSKEVNNEGKLVVSIPNATQASEEIITEHDSIKVVETNIETLDKKEICTEKEPKEIIEVEQAGTKISVPKDQKIKKPIKKDEEDIQVEYRRASQENIETIKDVDQINSSENFQRKNSSSSLSRSDSFSVKDEIEKIERQIKALEIKNASKDLEEKNSNNLQENVRHSIQENRRHFFKNMVENENDKGAIKIEFKEFPREQKDIHVVRLNDSPIPTVVSRDPIKVIELHISEPIRQKPEILEDVNPIPKPRRHSALNINDSQANITPTETKRSLESTRGKSL